MWVNLSVGPVMIAAGLWFGLLQPGSHNFVLLVAYLIVGGWYVYRGAMQIRARMQ